MHYSGLFCKQNCLCNSHRSAHILLFPFLPSCIFCIGSVHEHITSGNYKTKLSTRNKGQHIQSANESSTLGKPHSRSCLLCQATCNKVHLFKADCFVCKKQLLILLNFKIPTAHRLQDREMMNMHTEMTPQRNELLLSTPPNYLHISLQA